jgi:hypothetical protein
MLPVVLNQRTPRCTSLAVSWAGPSGHSNEITSEHRKLNRHHLLAAIERAGMCAEGDHLSAQPVHDVRPQRLSVHDLD